METKWDGDNEIYGYVSSLNYCLKPEKAEGMCNHHSNIYKGESTELLAVRLEVELFFLPFRLFAGKSKDGNT